MEDNKKPQDFSNFWELSTLGITLVFSTFIGLGIGVFLDKLFNTKPYLTIIFLLLGIVAGFINIFREIKRIT